jgi:hypothetical protein
MRNLEAVVDGKRKLYETSKMILIIVTCVASITILGMLINGMATLQTVTAKTNTLTSVLVDCTTPKGDCYKNANRRQSGTVKAINEVTVIVSYCAMHKENDTEDKIRKCVDQRMPQELP